MLIDATHPEETRVVVLRGNRVEEFDFESASRRQLRGNIYLAKVTRVEPSLQAAFIDYGGNRHGFLAFSEIHPDYYQIPVADRQALIDEEERAHRAADAEADRRAAARANVRAQPAGRTGHRGHRVASWPVAEAEPAESAEAADTAAEVVETFAQPMEFAPAEVDEEQKEGSPTPADVAAAASVVGPISAAETPPASEPDPATAEFERTEPPASEAQASETDRAAAATASPREPAEALGVSEPLLFGEPGIDAAAEANRASTQEPLAEDGDKAEAGPLALAPVSGEDDDDEDEDEEDDDDDDEEGAEAEEAVEMVGGADALEEAQERAPRVRRQYKIQEVIKRRQIMLVQVVKEERGTKGAALTTYLSLAGRYSVLMPNTARGGGISRKITNSQDRGRLKEIAQELEVPEGMGVILRTAGAARTKTEIKRDFEYLLRMWEQVRDLTLKSTAPTLVYEEGSVVKRAIRDLYTKDIDEVIVAGEEAYREAKDFMRMLMPSHAKNVKPYAESQPLLIRYGVESQLDAMFSPIVQLRSGGYIVLNQAEALVAIDVNSGRATREHHIEDTALKTNLEAAEEVSRQLRLRDLAGLIVIDFIDMDEKRNNRAVERRLKECLKNDRARIQVGRISHFGLLEMSRQRIRTSVFESSTEKCPHCGGTGHMRSVASVSLQCLRMLEEMLLRGATHNIAVRTGTEIALYMLNNKRAHLRELEQRFRIAIIVKADAPPNGQHPFLIEKGEQVHSLEQARALAAQPALLVPAPPSEEEEFEEEAEFEGEDVGAAREEAGEEADRAEAGENGSRRRRRRRRRGRRGEERPESVSLAPETMAEHAVAHEDHDGVEGEEEAGAGALARGPEPGEGEEETGGEARDAGDQRRRRRRGRRGGRRNRRSEGEAGAETGSPEEEAAVETGLPDETVEPVEREIIVAVTDFNGLPLGLDQPAGEPVGMFPELQPAPGASESESGVSPVVDAGDALRPSDQDDAIAARRPLDEVEPPSLAEQAVETPPVPAPDLAEPAVPAETRRRRSTVREPVSFLGEGAAGVPSAPAGGDEPASEQAPEEAAVPESEQPASRRTGWWARRLMGGGKG
jgi:ribonuclease E